tara:strand:+ start:2082 stop:2786 length:705 start_codon:yes stop_codon:yes gene_type:complete
MKMDSYTFLGSAFLTLSLLLKLMAPLDVYILKSLNSLMFSEFFFSCFTEIGNGLICLAVIAPILSYVSHKSNLNSIKIQTLVFTCVGTGLIVKVVKELTSVFALRPAYFKFSDVTFLEPIFLYSSFPSGHAATISSLFFVWIFLAFKKIEFRFKALVIFSLLSFALLVSLSRVVVAAHWLSDVLGSIALAFFMLKIIQLKVFKNLLHESKFAKYFAFFLIGLSWLYLLTTGTFY